MKGAHPPASTAALRAAAEELSGAGRLRQAAELLESAGNRATSDPHMLLQLGIARFRLGRHQEAVQAFLGVLQRDPRCASAYAQLGNVFQILRMSEEARECFRTALALGRSPVEMNAAIVFTSLESCRWDALGRDASALDSAIAAGHGQPAPFFCLNFPWPRRRLLAAAQAQAAATFGGIAALAARPRRRPGGRIRVGYVSGDLHEHATAHLVAELFECHDRARFDIHAYSYGEDDGSAMRARLRAAFGGSFHDVREIAPAELAARVRADAIDVLVDLKGYTLFARNEAFGYRAAPLQVNFLGFPGSLGCAHYDYIVGDPIVTPLAHADGYAEKIAQMPHCYQPNDRRRPLGTPMTRAECGLPPGAFVFACFNACYKITPEVFDRWCALLRSVPGSVLWLLVDGPQARRNLCDEAARRGVDPARLVWAANAPREQHLRRVACADLFLDTAPVNAHTTASDALWVGLPLVTTLGETFASRVAASLLAAAGLPELAARDLDEYESIARGLAGDPARLRALRARLAAGRDACPLFDSRAFARGFEELLARMVARLESGLAPEHLEARAVEMAHAA